MHEVLPLWDPELQQVEWMEQDVAPDSGEHWQHLLDHPFDALDAVFLKPWTRSPGVDDMNWQCHIFSMHAIVFEQCALATPCGQDASLLDRLLKAFSKLSPPTLPHGDTHGSASSSIKPATTALERMRQDQ